MNCVNCRVVPAGNNAWTAELESGPAGPYANRDMALRVAISEALRIYRADRQARVAVYSKDCLLQAEHCVCKKFAAIGRTEQAE